MATFLSTMIDRAKADKKTIVLPEGNDERILEAAEKALEQGLANIVIVGKPEEVAAKGFKLDGATIIDNTQGELRKEMAEAFYELRKSKGVTPEEAEAQMDDVMYFGTMLLKTGHADGLVGGACHATKDVLHPALRIIKTAPGSKLVSSFFVMEVPNCEFGDAGTFMFSDCAVCIQPNAEDLSEIAVATAKSYEKLLGAEARVAMLSHSSYGSVKDDDTQKVVEAQGSRLPCCRQGERFGLPRPRCCEHWLQACAASGEGRGVRPHYSGSGCSDERLVSRLLCRGRAGRYCHYRCSGTGGLIPLRVLPLYGIHFGPPYAARFFAL